MTTADREVLREAAKLLREGTEFTKYCIGRAGTADRLDRIATEDEED